MTELAGGERSTNAQSERLYRTLSLIRHVEEKIVEVYPSDVMQVPVHLSIGQEAIAAAVCAHLTDEDYKVGAHRSHSLYLGNGGDPAALFAELLGRRAGCAGGRGGSMHLIDPDRGLMGTSSIVGGALPIAVGLGMAATKPRLAAVLFGDAAADQGIFAESLNFAALKCVPVVFVCEDNRYSVYTPSAERRAAGAAELARAFGMATLEAPIEVASDVFALHEMLAEPIALVRRRAGPLFVHCHTVRALDHSGVGDDVAAGFRPPDERELSRKYCPLKVARAHLGPAAGRIDREVAAQVESAYRQALAGPEAAIEVDRE